MVRPTVHANPSRKSNRRNLNTPNFFLVVWTENILKTESFENDDVMVITWYPCPIFLKHKSKVTGDGCSPLRSHSLGASRNPIRKKDSMTSPKGTTTVALSSFSDIVWKKNIWRVFFWSNVNWALACFSSQSVGMIERVGERRAGKSALLFFPVSTER